MRRWEKATAGSKNTAEHSRMGYIFWSYNALSSFSKAFQQDLANMSHLQTITESQSGYFSKESLLKGLKTKFPNSNVNDFALKVCHSPWTRLISTG